MSQTCAISNGVMQGGVLSPILYSVYVVNLIIILTLSLRKNGATVSITFSNWQRNGATVAVSYFLLMCVMTS